MILSKVESLFSLVPLFSSFNILFVPLFSFSFSKFIFLFSIFSLFSVFLFPKILLLSDIDEEIFDFIV